ncbi:MAG: hypothetical protein JWP89_4932 [Schlesneria sp.]|nr:hypothetical protein [Schlesneria sp.]
MWPLAEEAPAKLIIDPPLPAVLARGMVLMQFRTENLQWSPYSALTR